MLEQKGLSDTEIEQYFTPAGERSWHGHEVADSLRHPEFETQKSYISDGCGGYVECPYGTAGAQRPDMIHFMEDGVEIREDKVYHDVANLTNNIKQQAADRYELWGDSLKDLTFAVADTGFTIEEAERIYEACDKAGADVEFVRK